MQMDLFTMLFVIGTSFSLIAAVMAFLISYEEYRKHFIDRRKTLAMSLQSAAVIMVFFVVVTLIIAFVFSNPQCLATN